jgi:hypothetical protein
MADLNDKHVICSPNNDHLTEREQNRRAPKIISQPASDRPESPPKQIRLGVCAMKKKINAKPMQEILHRLACKYFDIIIIDDNYWDK